MVRAEERRARPLAEDAGAVLELVIRKEHVVNLNCRVVLFSALLHLLGPHSAVNMDELVDLEWNEASSDLSFSIQAAE